MKNLKFKNLWILSKTEKAARKVSFGPKVNLITGPNDVGKSTLIKSLYHTLGADAPQINNARWSKAHPIYCVEASFGSESYFILRDGRFFGVFDQSRILVSKHQGISGPKGVANFICRKLAFQIELELSAGEELGLAGPAFYFLPFYVDQDAGWTNTWTSFSGLQQFKNYRKNLIEYHLGVRPQKYYDARRAQIDLQSRLKVHTAERDTLLSVRESYRERKAKQRIDLDPVVFKAEIESLVDQFGVMFLRQQQIAEELKLCRTRRNDLDAQINVLHAAIAELDADYSYAENPRTPEVLDCPTCGTEFHNQIAERFGLLESIDYCHAALDEKRKQRIDIQSELNDVESRYDKLGGELSNLEALLSIRRQEVTFSELIKSEGLKELDASISADIDRLVRDIVDLEQKLKALSGDLKVDSTLKKSIVESYQALMKDYLNALNVHVLEEDDYSRLDVIIKNNALGSDLPRSLLAQYFAFLHTMQAHNEFVVCPLVIDSPQQQEQDDANLDAIFSLIFQKTLPDQQLIVSTVALDSVSKEVIPEDANRLELGTKFRLLEKEMYGEVLEAIGLMHEWTLAS